MEEGDSSTPRQRAVAWGCSVRSPASVTWEREPARGRGEVDLRADQQRPAP